MMSRGISRRTVLKCGAALGAAALASGCADKNNMEIGSPNAQFATSTSPEEKPKDDKEPEPMKKNQYRAMWISYLDWATVDFSSEDTFRTSVGIMFDNCVKLGLNTVIAQVRPFADALYRSSLFPWSHICTGTQGQDPGFDPLDIMVVEAHNRAISLEAWINPYRIRLNDKMPPALAENGLFTVHPEWCVETESGVYLNPAIAEAADYVVQGVEEIVTNYAVDGIHFDDYFYPSTDASLDAAQYAAVGSGESLENWRRANVTRLVKNAYNAAKAKDPMLRFGISPQGNPDNNYNGQYSDVSAWIAPGTASVDYICPQVYWGYHYTMQNGSDRFAFENITQEWLAMDRDENVSLYFGLGAYRIGAGDGGQNEDSVTQWQSGHNLADMIDDLTTDGADGYALYRYNSLYINMEQGEYANQECEAISADNAERDAAE